MPWKVYKENDLYCVHKQNDDGSKGEKVACHTTASKANKQLKALYANSKEGFDDSSLYPEESSLFSFTDMLQELQASNNKLMSEIDGMAAGTFTSMMGDKITFKPNELPEYISNTNKILESTRDSKGEIVGLPIDMNNHDHQGGAGWIVGVKLDKARNVIRLMVKWTEEGARVIKANLRRFFSPSVNPENKTIGGGSLTNWPATRNDKGAILLRPVELSLSIKEIQMEDNNNILEMLKALPARIAELMSSGKKSDNSSDDGDADGLTDKDKEELKKQYLAELSKSNFTVSDLLQTPEAIEKLGQQAQELAQQAIKAEARKMHAVQFAAEICGGTQEKPFGLPIKATEIVSLLLSLPEAQAQAVEKVLRQTHLSAIDFAQHGFDGSGSPLRPKLPEPIHTYAVKWIAAGKDISEFMRVNAVELGDADQYDLSEFVKEK